MLTFFLFLLCYLRVLSLDESEIDALKKDWCGKKNCYEILGVDPVSTQREIKEQYNKLSLSLHPDKNPNQTDLEKQKYVEIVQAYEILSNTKLRDEYDNYEKIKRIYDSPRESLLVVIIIIYGISIVVVLQFKKQRHKEIKKKILDNQNIKRYFKDKGIEITSKGIKIKKNKKQKKNKNNNKIVNELSNEQIDDALKKLNLIVPGWTLNEPDWKTVAAQIPGNFLWIVKKICYKISFRIKYQILNQEMNDEDRQYCCRKNFDISEEEWNLMSEEQRNNYLATPGQWRKKNKKKND